MKTIKKIINIIFLILISILILYTTIILIKKFVFKEDIPSIFGIKSFIVVSGSMEPTMKVGDIVFIQETDDIHENDIIAFKYNNSVITHRVEKMVGDGEDTAYLTKGDANSQVDAEMILRKDLCGKYIFKIDKLGNVILFLRTKNGLIGISVLFLILLLIFICSLRKKNDVEKDEDIIAEKVAIDEKNENIVAEKVAIDEKNEDIVAEKDEHIELKNSFEKIEKELISEEKWTDIEIKKDTKKDIEKDAERVTNKNIKKNKSKKKIKNKKKNKKNKRNKKRSR